MPKPKGYVTAAYGRDIVSGASYCFRSERDALRESARSTVNPGVLQLNHRTGALFLACGDDWISPGGQRGTHYYGRGGRYIEVLYI